MADLRISNNLPRVSDAAGSKIIWSAYVIDADDPLKLNRIRVNFKPLVDNRDNTSILNSVPDKLDNKDTKLDPPTDLRPEFQWTPIDPFCVQPLLPTFFKITPKIGEMVNIIWPNTEFKFNEQYYFPASPTSGWSLYKDQFDRMQMFASRDKNLLPAAQFNDVFGIFPKSEDVAIMGRGTADLLVKEDHVVIRAGRSTQYPNNLNNPLLPKSTRSFHQLSNFNERIIDLGTKSTNRLQPNIAFVRNLIEWDIINPENQANPRVYYLNIFLYGLPQKAEYTTENLQINSNINNADKSLIYVAQFNQISSGDAINNINTFIKQVNDGEINFPNLERKKIQNQFPLVFRPSPRTYRWISVSSNNSTPEYKNISSIANRIKFNKEGSNGFGLIFFRNKPGQQQIVRTEKLKEIDIQQISTTYNILGADKLLLLSHESRIPSKGKIILEDSTISLIEQKYLVENVVPNTDPMVRGDELFKFLNLVVRFLVSHVHALPGLPPVSVSTDGTQSQQILNELQNASKTILNQEIRIN